MTSHPPAHCCTVGVTHEGEATGETKEVGGISTYLAYPPSKATTKAILLLTDVLGHKFINAQLMADKFAANGYFVAMPDLFSGDPVPINRPPGFDLSKWITTPPSKEPEVVDGIVSKVIDELRSKYHVDRLAAAAYCFGAKALTRFMAQGKGIQVGFAAHPSGVDASELEQIKGPYSIAAAEVDHIFTTEKRHETETILAKTGLPYQVVLFGGTTHGFAVRGDTTNAQVKFAKEAAFEQAVVWFNEWL